MIREPQSSPIERVVRKTIGVSAIIKGCVGFRAYAETLCAFFNDAADEKRKGMERMKTEKTLTLIVNSCDKYEDAWHPFFECWWHFAGEFPYPIILNTETKSYHSPHYNIKCVNTPDKGRLIRRKPTWSERLENVLSEVETEFVLFTLDDYFIKNTFDYGRLNKVIGYMEQTPDVGVVEIRPHWAESKEEEEQNKIKYKDSGDSFTIREKDRFNIVAVPTVWRTDVLRYLLRSHEDVWDFEIYSGIRAKKYGIKVCSFNTRYPTIYEYDYQIWTGMGITQGQWLPKNKDFFSNLGIEVNFDRLGILNVSSPEEIKRKNRLNPITIAKKIPKKIRKRLTKRLSMK